MEFHQEIIKTRREKINGVQLPYAIERKYPNAGKSFAWQWYFLV